MGDPLVLDAGGGWIEFKSNELDSYGVELMDSEGNVLLRLQGFCALSVDGIVVLTPLGVGALPGASPEVKVN